VVKPIEMSDFAVMTLDNESDGGRGRRLVKALSSVALPPIAAGSVLLLAVSALAFMRLPLAPGGGRSLVALLLLGIGGAAALGAIVAWVIGTSTASGGSPSRASIARFALFAFIASEIMFFAAYFAVYLYYAADTEVAGLTAWPPPGARPPAAWGGPLLNTLILLVTGAAVARAHDAGLRGSTTTALLCLLCAIALGLAFLGLQGREYWLSQLRFQDGIYPSLFYLTTGFHAFHVAVGLAMLAVSATRLLGSRFDPRRHFGFEASVWYWHFVDAVWLMLFAVFYVWVI
jgi:cytochrome c oxidase subunit 3